MSGSLPPDACGVGAYVERLAESLRACGVDADVVGGDTWRAIDATSIKHRVDALQPDIVHLQYPTLGYGSGLAPHVLSILRPGVVTLHEVRHTHPLRRLSLAAFALSALHVVFTTEFERRYMIRFAPWLRERSSVIPVGSNVPAVITRTNLREREVVHFGLIRPEKGLEQVIELAVLLQRHGPPFDVRIVGEVAPKWSKYFQQLQRSSADLPIIWDVGLTLTRVAEVLAVSRIGYLPFPDGASARRASLLALLNAGVATITTRGADTPDSLSGVVAFARDAHEALNVVERLSADPETTERLAIEGRRYARRAGWDSIAAMHRSLYHEILSKRQSAAEG